MNEKTELNPIVIEPREKAEKSIIWLHGLGADGNDFVPIVPDLKISDSMKLRFIFPNAPIMPVTINNGYRMRAWYDIYDFEMQNPRIDSKGIAASVSALGELIQSQIALGILPQNILLAGFSQGAVIALLTGLTYPQPLAGIIALSGYFPLADQTLAQASAANKQIPIFMGHGTADPIVPVNLGKMSCDLLKSAGYPVSWHAYPMPHSVCPEEIQQLLEWMRGIWRSS